MNRHHMSQIEVTESEVGSDEDPQGREGGAPVARPQPRRRRSSDPSADRPVARRQPRDEVATASESEDVEDLPDRFDAQGRPLDGQPQGSRPRWTTRSGQFERRPQRAGDWDVRGSWSVGGTDRVPVDRLAKSFTEALDGRKSWLGLVGDVLGGGLLQPGQGQGQGRDALDDEQRGNDDDDEPRHGRHRRRR